MYLGGTLNMIPRSHVIGAFRETDAALEIRMTHSSLRGCPSRTGFLNEVLAC